MKKVEAHVLIEINKHNNLDFSVRGWEMLLENLRMTFLKGSRTERNLIMSLVAGDGLYITNEQRGYILAGLGPLVLEQYRSWGYDIKTPKEAIDMIKLDPDVDFTMEVVSMATGEIKKVPMSLANNSGVPREEINVFIDRIFRWLVDLKHRPLTSTEYKRFKTLRAWNKD